jgi:hypothetical protein
MLAIVAMRILTNACGSRKTSHLRQWDKSHIISGKLLSDSLVGGMIIEPQRSELESYDFL